MGSQQPQQPQQAQQAQQPQQPQQQQLMTLQLMTLMTLVHRVSAARLRSTRSNDYNVGFGVGGSPKPGPLSWPAAGIRIYSEDRMDRSWAAETRWS